MAIGSTQLSPVTPELLPLSGIKPELSICSLMYFKVIRADCSHELVPITLHGIRFLGNSEGLGLQTSSSSSSSCSHS